MLQLPLTSITMSHYLVAFKGRRFCPICSEIRIGNVYIAPKISKVRCIPVRHSETVCIVHFNLFSGAYLPRFYMSKIIVIQGLLDKINVQIMTCV